MKAIRASIVAAATLFVAAGVGFGTAQAGASDWNVDALDAFHVVRAESAPVLTFEEQAASDYRAPESAVNDMALAKPLETGSLPSGNYVKASTIEAGGLEYRIGIDTN